MKTLKCMPGWMRRLDEHAGHFSDAGLGGLIDHYAVTNRLGELLARGTLPPAELAEFLKGRAKRGQRATQPKAVAKVAELAADHFRVHVSYAPVPTMEELKKLFPGGVSEVFDGREWKKHASCVGMDETPGERDFLVRSYGRAIDSEDVIALADRGGYRPATHQEAVEFAKVHPELQKQRWIVALGSFALNDDDRFVAVLSTVGGGRVLNVSWFGNRWLAGPCFLLVRK